MSALFSLDSAGIFYLKDLLTIDLLHLTNLLELDGYTLEWF